MKGYQEACCLFCQTGSEEMVVRQIESRGLGHAIFAERVKTIRMGSHHSVETRTPLIPGYVFIYTEGAMLGRAELLRLSGVIRVLSYGDREDSLKGRDLEFADWLWRNDGVIGAMQAIKVGSRVVITDPIFRDMQGIVVRMDRRKQTVKVQMSLGGADQYIWLSYKVVEEKKE